jgi:GxxExxY protein
MDTKNTKEITKSTKKSEKFDPLSGRVIQCALAVHRSLGPGLLESVYEQCLAHELSLAGIHTERQRAVPLNYKDLRIECGYRLDLLVDDQLVVELKTVDQLLPVHEAQILTYMKMSGMKTGLLINFNSKFLKQGIKRYVF